MLGTLQRRALTALAALFVAQSAFATADDFERKVDKALAHFYAAEPQARAPVDAAAGVLIFPQVSKIGLGVGGALGDGALRVGGQTVQCYRTTALSVGFQIGAQRRTEILVFTTTQALEAFRKSENWAVGVDGSIAIADLGDGKSVDSDTIRPTIVGYIVDDKGLMYDLSLKGSKYWKITKAKRANP
jgi:lipid-binding SYLF domain-containing protein